MLRCGWGRSEALIDECKQKIILKSGEYFKHTGSRMKGFMQETDIDSYDVLSAEGQKVGSVVIEDHTAVKGFARTVSLCQRDHEGVVIIEESWRM